jgi:two-component system cell cycle sensor histidine kinase/response regulator CckA
VRLFRELVENLPIVTYVDEPGQDGRTLYISPQVEHMLGYPIEAWLGDPDFLFEVLHPDDRAWLLEHKEAAYDESSLALRVVSREGRVFTIQRERVVLRDESGAPRHMLGFWVDITDRVQLEEELRQVHKLEAIGRLAGGVAHDFNNLLLAQRGYGELALQHLKRGDYEATADDVAEMLNAADRASKLTHQLLAFARRQVLDLEVLDLNVVVADLEQLLRRLIGENIELVVTRAAAPLWVRADRGQLEQVITNLGINARDAMLDGGRLEIELASDAAESVRLVVRDTGRGMDSKTMAEIFEPFFTTKGSSGTGLGLATVHGIVTQSGGQISVQSEPGGGTAFTILLPRATSAPVGERKSEKVAPAGGGESVLLVEDDESVGRAVRGMLETRGFRVLCARSGDDAIEIARTSDGNLDVLLTDLVMPGRDGRETARKIRRLRPQIGVLFMSGYTDNYEELVGHETRSGFIQKPFTGDELARELRRILDQTRR